MLHRPRICYRFSNFYQIENDAHTSYVFSRISSPVQEWRIWSKCFGKVLILNGLSSSGKTTLLNKFREIGFNGINLDDIYLEHRERNLSTINNKEMILLEGISDALGLGVLRNFLIKDESVSRVAKNLGITIQLLDSRIEELKNEPSITSQQLYLTTYLKIKPFLFSGKNVIIAAMHFSEASLSRISSYFDFYPIYTCLLFAPLKDNLSNCLGRNYQSIFQNRFGIEMREPVLQILKQYKRLYRLETKPKYFVAHQDKNDFYTPFTMPYNWTAYHFNVGEQILDVLSSDHCEILIQIAEEHCTMLCKLFGDLEHLPDRDTAKSIFRKIIAESNEIFVLMGLKHDFVFIENRDNTSPNLQPKQFKGAHVVYERGSGRPSITYQTTSGIREIEKSAEATQSLCLSDLLKEQCLKMLLFEGRSLPSNNGYSDISGGKHHLHSKPGYVTNCVADEPRQCWPSMSRQKDQTPRYHHAPRYM